MSKSGLETALEEGDRQHWTGCEPEEQINKIMGQRNSKKRNWICVSEWRKRLKREKSQAERERKVSLLRISGKDNSDKSDLQKKGGLLEPLPVPSKPWESVHTPQCAALIWSSNKRELSLRNGDLLKEKDSLSPFCKSTRPVIASMRFPKISKKVLEER